MYIHVPAYLYNPHVCSAHGGQQSALDPPEEELEVFMRQLMWELSPDALQEPPPQPQPLFSSVPLPVPTRAPGKW